MSLGDERENKLSVTSVYTAAHLILHTPRRRAVPFRCNYSRFQTHPFRRADFVNRRWRTGAEWRGVTLHNTGNNQENQSWIVPPSSGYELNNERQEHPAVPFEILKRIGGSIKTRTSLAGCKVAAFCPMLPKYKWELIAISVLWNQKKNNHTLYSFINWKYFLQPL